MFDVLLALAALVLVLGAGKAVWDSYMQPKTAASIAAPVNVPEAATPAVAAVASAVIAPPKVQVYAQSVKQQLHLPDAVKKDSDKFVVAQSQIVADSHAHEVSTVVDEKTGQVTTMDTRLALPWFAAQRGYDVMVATGYTTRSATPVIHLEARADLLQVKAVHVGLVGYVDEPMNWKRPDAFVGVGAWARF